MQPGIYGPYPFVPITERKGFRWPNGARVALWVIPNIEFFHLDDPMPGTNNERIARPHAKIPNVRNWALRDYGNRVGIWRFMEVMSRYGIRGTAALNSEICTQHPQIMEAAMKLGWEFMGHCQTNAIRLNEMEPEREKEAIHDTLEVIAKTTGKKPLGWLGAGLAETWSTLDFLIAEGCQYIADWTADDLPFRMNVSGKTIYSIPYSLQCNDTPQFFDQKLSAAEFGEVLMRQFDWLYREGAETSRVMAIALHPFVSGAPYRMGPIDAAFEYICKHDGVWLATGEEIIRAYIESGAKV
jgi:peptidoglycan/xylan/chitin deacetylase (PgdA/CDA1 family)